MGEWTHDPAAWRATLQNQEAMKRSVLRSGVDAIARMSTTRTNYWAELVVDSALGMLLLVEGWRRDSGPAWIALLVCMLGLFAFSFIEYFFHRWLFHTHIPLFEQGHRMHHERPLGYDSLPFFLPALVLLTLTALLLAIMPHGYALLMAGSITFGYIAYGLSHFIIHHVRFKQPFLRRWAGAHHVHHYHPECNFGVTTPLWDMCLGTRYVRRPRKA